MNSGDVSDYSALSAVFAEIVQDFSSIDCLIAGAGVGGTGKLVTSSKEGFRELLESM